MVTVRSTEIRSTNWRDTDLMNTRFTFIILMNQVHQSLFTTLCTFREPCHGPESILNYSELISKTVKVNFLTLSATKEEGGV